MNRTIAAAGLTLLLLAPALAACGSDATPSAADPNTAATATAQPSGTAPRPGGGARTVPGASGLIADVTGSTLQVQSSDQQTAVSWTAKTSITTSATATADDLTAGGCVTVRQVAATGGATPTASTGPAPAPTEVTAASVEISAPTKGTCAPGGFGGPAGAGPDGAGRPSGGGQPSDVPDGSGNGAGGGPGIGQGGRRNGLAGAGFRVSGSVVSVDSGSFVVREVFPADPAGRRQGTPSATSLASPAGLTVTVHLTAATTFTQRVRGTAKDIVTGRCVTAFGARDDTGAITATSLALSSATNGQCPAIGRGVGAAGGPAGTAPAVGNG